MTTMTTAQKISSQLQDDGSTWQTDDGVSLTDLCVAAGGKKDREEEQGLTRYTFPDGSALTLGEGGWDVGYPDCWCWQAVGHKDCDEPEAYPVAVRAWYDDQSGGAPVWIAEVRMQTPSLRPVEAEVTLALTDADAVDEQIESAVEKALVGSERFRSRGRVAVTVER